MKHHIAVKFIAFFLAALFLLTGVASAIAIAGLTGMDLYQQTVDEYYTEQTEASRRHFAVNLVHRYASLELGSLPEIYLEAYYGSQWYYDTFQWDCFFYTIYDEQNNAVESTMDQAEGPGTYYIIEITDLNYRRMIPSAQAAGIQSGTSSSDATVNTTPPEATVPSTSVPPETTVPETTAPDETVVPETGPSEDPESFVSYSTETAIAAKDSRAVYDIDPDDICWDTYFDYTTGRYVDIAYIYQKLAPYTVELFLTEGAMPEAYAWTLLRQIWIYRYELFYVLVISLVAFAALAVYLCCSAGRKPGREEIRAGGLNCLPLDLYLAGGATAVVLLVALGMEVAYYLLTESPTIFIPFVALAGYLCALIVVAFLFACAAQFKTPNGYWWRNTVIGRSVRLVVRLTLWLHELLAHKAFPFLGRFLKGTWDLAVRCVKALFHGLEKLFRWSRYQFLPALWQFMVRAFLALRRKFGHALHWCGRKLNRIYSMLPLTWQWLLAAFLLIFLIFLAFASNSDGGILLSLAAAVSLVLYGSHCFGILLESTKRMGKGDLETKVSDQFLLGSFKEFAGDLNALADVAIVAAQKQLRSERMKTELITNVSHDIKTPLTSIINYVDLLQKPHTDEEQEQYLEVLSRQSGQLKRLIEDLMEMSKASTGNMTVDITSVNAGEAINQALGEFSDKLEKAQLTPVFRQPEAPIYMKADGRLAWRVMSNLLSNAYKYALPGTRLYIDLMELEGKVIISMKNISREELNVSADELLERFVRGDTSRNTEGSGLGLNIAQSLMELQKGQLQLLVDGDLFKVTLVFPAA